MGHFELTHASRVRVTRESRTLTRDQIPQGWAAVDLVKEIRNRVIVVALAAL